MNTAYIYIEFNKNKNIHIYMKPTTVLSNCPLLRGMDDLVKRTLRIYGISGAPWCGRYYQARTVGRTTLTQTSRILRFGLILPIKLTELQVGGQQRHVRQFGFISASLDQQHAPIVYFGQPVCQNRACKCQTIFFWFFFFNNFLKVSDVRCFE